MSHATAVVAEVEPITAGAADSWPSWTDEFTWELGPEDTTDHSEAFEPTLEEQAERLAWIAADARLAIVTPEELERDEALSAAMVDYWIAEREDEFLVPYEVGLYGGYPT